MSINIWQHVCAKGNLLSNSKDCVNEMANLSLQPKFLFSVCPLGKYSFSQNSQPFGFPLHEVIGKVCLSFIPLCPVFWLFTVKDTTDKPSEWLAWCLQRCVGHTEKEGPQHNQVTYQNSKKLWLLPEIYHSKSSCVNYLVVGPSSCDTCHSMDGQVGLVSLHGL